MPDTGTPSEPPHRRPVWRLVRFLAAAACFAFSLLTVVPAPTMPVFEMEVAATEYGHWLMLAPLAIAMAGRPRRRMDFLTLLLALASVALFVYPAIRARSVARALPGLMAEHFGPAAHGDGEPLSWSRLWFGREPKPMPTERITYASERGESLAMDFYRSASSAPAPCIIVLHTGSWRGGTPEEFVGLNSHLAQRGYAVAAIEYRLAPRWRWPAPFEDVRDAVTFLKAKSATLGIDPGRFVLLGRSAGGQIAEASAYELRDPAIRGCIAFYGPADMEFGYQTGREDDIVDSPQRLRDYLGGTPEQALETYRNASAIRQVRADVPPTLMLHGTRDEIVLARHSERLADALARAGTKALLVELPWATHGFDYNFDGPGGQIGTWAVDAFLAAVTQDRAIAAAAR